LQWTDFHEIFCLRNFFRNSSRKLKHPLNKTKISETLHEQLLCLFVMARRFLATITNVLDKSYREHKNDILGLINFLWKLFCLWDNVRTARQATVWFVCWVTQNMLYLLLFHDKNWYANAPQYNVILQWNVCSILRSIALHINRFCMPCNLVTFTHL
jgi:hypothetical protein